MAARRGWRWARRVGLVLGSLAVGLTLAECGLRAAGYATRAALYYDPAVGFRFYPHQRRAMIGEGARPLAHMTINAHGYRDPAFREPRRAGVLRVACVGDSFTFGWGVEDDQSYPAVLQALLDTARGPGAVEVMNFGVPGYNTEDELHTYVQVARAFRPDVVLVGFFLNDVAPRQLGMRNTDNAFFRLFGRTALVELFHRRLRGRLGWFELERSPEERARAEVYRRQFYQIHHDPSARVAGPYWYRALAALSRLLDEARADGASTLVLAFPSAPQIRRVRVALRATPALAEAVERDVRGPQERLLGHLAARGAPALDLFGVFRDLDADPFGERDPAHPSAAGYRATAEAVAAALERLGRPR